MKRAISLLLCLVLLCLCACGKEQDKSAEIAQEADVEVPFFTKETLKDPYPDTALETAVGAGESIVVCGVDSRGERRLFRMDTSNRSFTLIEGVSLGYIETIDGLSDGRAVLTYNDENGIFMVCEIGADNSVTTAPLALPKELEGGFIFDLKAVENGYLFTAYEENTPYLYTVDRQGTLLTRTACEGYEWLYILRCEDDSLAVAGVHDGKTTVRLLAGDLSIAQEYSLKTKFASFVSGGDSDEIIAVLPSGKACVADLKTGELRGYANLAWLSQRGFVPLSDTEFFSVSDGKPAIWTMSGSQERITLTLYTIFEDSADMGGLRNSVNGFNESSGQYYIEIVDYGVYGAEAETRLVTDIVTGSTPDIYDMNNLNGANCYANGLMEDLKPYFDSDPDISYEDIIAGVRRVIERDGAVYDLIPSFGVTTVFAPKSIVGEGSFTVDDLMSLAEEYGSEKLFGGGKSGARLLLEAIIYCGDFIDERTAQCSFDSPDFIKLLELAKTFPASGQGSGDDYMAVYYGNALLYRCRIDGLNTEEGLTTVDALYRSDWRSVGFPSAEGTGVTLSPGLRLGMSSNSEHKEGVWEFFKYLLSSRYQWNINQGMPVIENVLEQDMDGQIQLQLVPHSLGLGYSDENGNYVMESLKLDPPTEELKARMWELIDSMGGINEYDYALNDIVQSEAAKFFAGDRTAEETAAAIQSRASIYMAEQYG